jgi:hypothetical protein
MGCSGFFAGVVVLTRFSLQILVKKRCVMMCTCCAMMLHVYCKAGRVGWRGIGGVKVRMM